MFNKDTINQLAQLKKDILDSKDIASGTVVGSNGRFGFVKLEDGRDAYLSPEKMQRLIPGDQIKVNVVKNDKDKLEAELEKLLQPGLDRFVGTYRIKSKAHFVQPSGAQSAKWLFVPPQSRQKAKEGDIVVAKLQSHPFKNGKASVKILEKIGSPKDNKFELKYVLAKYQFNREHDDAALKQADEISKQFVHEAFGERKDLSEIPFLTIDGATTKDMDDAIAIETVSSGDSTATRLHVAIADPSSFIASDSPLAKSALQRAQTHYFLGGSVPMLPINIGHDCFSLEPEKLRPALVCHIDFADDGSVVNSEFEFSLIKSRHKLSYEQVALLLENVANKEALDDDALPPTDCHEQLIALEQLALLRRSYREKNQLVSPDQDDFDYTLDEQGHIAEVRRRLRNNAHRIVEEAMLATNSCGAELLAEHKQGLSVSHPGFRPERIGEVKALLKEEEVEFAELEDLQGFVSLFQNLQSKDDTALLIPPLKRMLSNAELSTSSAPHLNMGASHYATITSPIRRYADIYNHWAIQSILLDKKPEKLSTNKQEKLNETLQRGRQADRELFQWLQTIYADTLIGKEAQAIVRIVTQQGFGCRMNDSGIEGFVLFPKNKEKNFDAKRMTLEVDGVTYRLDDKVAVKVASVDHDKKRVAFSLADTEK